MKEKITPIIIETLLNQTKQPPSDEQIQAIMDELDKRVDDEGYVVVFDGEEEILDFIKKEIDGVVERMIDTK